MQLIGDARRLYVVHDPRQAACLEFGDKQAVGTARSDSPAFIGDLYRKARMSLVESVDTAAGWQQGRSSSSWKNEHYRGYSVRLFGIHSELSWPALLG